MGKETPEFKNSRPQGLRPETLEAARRGFAQAAKQAEPKQLSHEEMADNLAQEMVESIKKRPPVH